MDFSEWNSSLLYPIAVSDINVLKPYWWSFLSEVKLKLLLHMCILMFMDDGGQDVRLRKHIQCILHDYAPKYVTRDYMQYTEILVSKILSETLSQVPAQGPDVLVLPVEPFKVLESKLELCELPAYDECWETSAEALKYIKLSLSVPGREKSIRVWDEESKANYANVFGRPMSPVLSRSALSKTPQFGSKKNHAHNENESSLASFLKSRTASEMIEVVESHLSRERLEDLMDIKLAIDASTHRGVLDCQRKTPFFQRQLASSSNDASSAYMSNFLRSKSPPYERKFREMSPPVFGRGRGASTSTELCNTPALASSGSPMLPNQPLDVQDSDFDFSTGSMAVVNGWTAFALNAPCSSQGTPSLSPDISEANGLSDVWKPSSPRTVSSPITTLHSVKMEVPIFPRTAFPLGSQSIDPTRGNTKAQSLSAFISSYPSISAEVQIVTAPKSDDEVITLAAMSMVGQPPSDSSTDVTGNSTSVETNNILVHGTGNDLKNIIKHIYGHADLGNYQDVIIHERLDEKESMYMNVPTLPPPNSYIRQQDPKSHYYSALPSLRSLVCHTPAANVPDEPSMVLKKVTGLKALNLELSWRPFSFGTMIPTHDDLADTTFGSGLGLALGYDDLTQEEIDSLVTRFNIDSDLTNFVLQSEELFLGDATDLDMTFGPLFEEDSLVILTRAERCILSEQLADSPNDTNGHCFKYSTTRAPDLDSDDINVDPETSDQEHYDLRIQKKPRYGTVDESNSNPMPSSLLQTVEHLPIETGLCGDTLDNCGSSGASSLMDHSSAVQMQLSKVIHNMSGSIGLTGPSNNIALDATYAITSPCRNPLHSETRYIDNVGCDKIGPSLPDALDSLSSANDNLAYEKNFQTNILKAPTHANYVNPTRTPIDAISSLLCDRSSLDLFLRLRNKTVKLEDPTMRANTHPQGVRTDNNMEANQVQPTGLLLTERSAPSELLTEVRALTISNHWKVPNSVHVYIASLDLIQKRALVRVIESDLCAVTLVEREFVSSGLGVKGPSDSIPLLEPDVVLSPEAAAICFPLAAIPSQVQYQLLLSSLSFHSWRFSHILVILEAFPRSFLYSSKSGNNYHEKPYAYSPPVLKAVRRIRRDLCVREGLGEKWKECNMELAFADGIEEEAKILRAFGDNVLSTNSVDYTQFVGEDEQEGERDLAMVEGMNSFCAAVILKCCSLNEFLDMTYEQRVDNLGHLVDPMRLNHVSAVLQNRMEAMETQDLQSFSELSTFS